MNKEVVQRNEIISILNNMRLRHLSINVKERDRRFNLSGFITRADTNSISIFFDNIPDFVPTKNLKICFDYNKSYYTSSETALRMLNISIKSLELLVPDKFSFHAIRKYARLDVADQILLNIKNVVTGSSEEAQKVNIDELPVTLRNIYVELEAETPDVKKIIGMIGEELGRYSNRFRINLFKDMGSLAPIEKVVSIYKKTFWIGDTDNLNNYLHLGDKYSIIGYEKYFEMIKKTMTPDILEQIRQNYVTRAIGSYAMVPINVGDRIVGVIEVSVPNDSKFKKLSIYEIFYIKGLADILAEVIVKSHGASTDADFNFHIVDISAGGLLANTKNMYVTRSIKENSIVLLNLKSEGKDLDVKSRVVRYNYMPGENAGLNVGFEFLMDDDSKKADVANLIKKFVKGNANA